MWNIITSAARFELEAEVTWEQVTSVLSQFSQTREMAVGKGVLPLANHSIGGREWIPTPGANPEFVYDPGFNPDWDGFLLLREEEVEWLRFTSATSASRLEARCLRRADPSRGLHSRAREGVWELRLSVPLEGDAPYKGAYWKAFEEVVGSPTTSEPEAAPPLEDWERKFLGL